MQQRPRKEKWVSPLSHHGLVEDEGEFDELLDRADVPLLPDKVADLLEEVVPAFPPLPLLPGHPGRVVVPRDCTALR